MHGQIRIVTIGLPMTKRTRTGKLRPLHCRGRCWPGMRAHKRELPWRQDRDAYRVWVSEIMLQQTRVAAVLEHYRIFLEAFPTVQALALAPEERVLALWSGLGYYRRARMLHQAARLVVSELGGVIPRAGGGFAKAAGSWALHGLGHCEHCLRRAVAVVDGNVERVLSRLDGEPRTGAAAWKRAQELLDRRHPGDWNQAMMELGATVCTPQQSAVPGLPGAPVVPRSGGGDAASRRPARKRVQMTRALIEREPSRVPGAARRRMRQRWPECGSFRCARSAKANTAREAAREPDSTLEGSSQQLCVLRHSITDTDYVVRVVRLRLKALGAKEKKLGRWVGYEEIVELPLTGLTRKILRKLGGHGGMPRTR